MNGVPFFAVAGTILKHVDLGRLRYVEHLGDWVLHIVLEADPDAGPIRVQLPGSDERIMPTVPWVLEEFAAGRLTDVGNTSDEDIRAGRFLGLDRAACMARDPKSAVFMDGTEFEHACLYSEDWPIASNKMKGVFAMDAHTQYVFPGAVFAGPYRAEMGIQAALNVMVPPAVTAADIAKDPYAGLLVGLPSDLMYDNDKAQLPPALVPASVTVTSSTELAPAYLHDAKSPLEVFNRYLKRKLRGVKGRIRGPSRMADPRYDPIKAAEVTRAVYAQMVDDARREWNAKPRKRFGNKSPRDLMIEHHLAGGNPPHHCREPVDRLLQGKSGAAFCPTNALAALASPR